MKEENTITNKILKINILWLFLSLFAFLLIDRSVENVTENFDILLLFIGWCSNLFYFWSVFSIYKINRNFLDYNIVFLTFLFLFCNGQVFLYTIGIKPESMLVFNASNPYQIFNAECYFYFSLLFYQIGMCFGMKIKKENISDGTKDRLFTKAIKIVAGTMILTSIYPFLVILLPKLRDSILYGYEYLYQDPVEYSGMFGYLSKMFVPGLLLLLYCSKGKTNRFMFVIGVLFLIIVANLIIGARGDAISLFVITTIFYNDYKKKFEGIKVLRLVGIGLVVMILIPTIAIFRSEENKTVGKFFETMIENISVGENNFIVKTVSELGGTMYAFVLTEEVVPSVVQYKNGESYLASLLMIIPSKLMGGYSFAPKAALDIWLQNIHQLPYGPGFSLLAETYYNFGYVGGVFFAIVLGYVFSKILTLKSNDENKKGLLKLLSLIFLYNSMLVARFPFHSTPRNLVYMYIMPYVIINIIYKYLKRRSVNYE